MKKTSKSTVIIESDESESENIPIPKTKTVSKSDTKLTEAKLNDIKNKSDERVIFTKALNNFANVSKDLNIAIDFWKEITTDKIQEIIIQIESKKKEYNELIENMEKEYLQKEKDLSDKYKDKEKNFETKYNNIKNDFLLELNNNKKENEQKIKNLKIDTEQELKEFQIQACEEIAIKNDYKLISLNEYEKIESELKVTKDKLIENENSFNDRVLEKIELEKQILQDKLKQDNLTKDLNHKAEIAELIAQNKQQIKEIEFLNKQIDNLTNEVSEQRNLTKEIAKASSKAQITQSFSKE